MLSKDEQKKLAAIISNKLHNRFFTFEGKIIAKLDFGNGKREDYEESPAIHIVPVAQLSEILIDSEKVQLSHYITYGNNDSYITCYEITNIDELLGREKNIPHNEEVGSDES